MVTITAEVFLGGSDRLNANGLPVPRRDAVCLSGDAKPTDWENGSTLLEMDTGKVYVYDKANTTWREL